MDVEDHFPDECEHVINVLADVYHNDDQTKKQAMTPEQRLTYHQEHSGPLMAGLLSWLNKQLNGHLVEPNSGLGKAIAYMINHWPELTRFLKVPGALLDNNICERSLKQSLLHRKNSLFYKTEHGAFVGDMFMSLIQTCNLMRVNPFDYLVSLFRAHFLSSFGNQTGLCQHFGIKRTDLSDFKNFSHTGQNDQKDCADNQTYNYMRK